MAKTYHSSNRWALAGLFKRISVGDDLEQIQSEARHLAQKVDSDDIAAAKQALVDEGYPCPLTQKIADVFVLIGMHQKKGGRGCDRFTGNHILQKIKAEHAMAVYNLRDLVQLSDEINYLENMINVSSEFRRLTRLLEFFAQFKLHIEREEEVIFPYLQKYGWKGLCKTAKKEHKQIIMEIDNLNALVRSLAGLKFGEFNDYLQRFVQNFFTTLTQHLAYEEDIFWPISLIVLDDMRTWDTIKALCDEFEY